MCVNVVEKDRVAHTHMHVHAHTHTVRHTGIRLRPEICALQILHCQNISKGV